MIIDNRYRIKKQELKDEPANFTFSPDVNYAQRGGFTSDIERYSALKDIHPTYLYEFIDIISWLAIFNPDMSQTVKKIISLGNVGHSLEIEGSERAADAAQDELNDLARNAFSNAAGMDGFINQQFRQIIVKGTLCQEAVPSLALNGIEEIYQVKVSSIRFKFEENRFVPYQKQGIDKVRLNEETFLYIPLQTEEDNPYPILPFIAALRSIIRQDKQWEGLDEFTALWGLMGFTHMTVDIRPLFGEAEPDFQARANRELRRYYEMFTNNRQKGVAVLPPSVGLEHKAVGKGTGQMSEAMEKTHQAITSGLNIDPALLGYAYSTTETYATVCYQTLLGEIANIRRIVKRGNERIYNQHLLMRKIPAVCTMTFNPAPSLKAYEEAQTKEIEQRMIYQRMDKGTIGPDDAARELGYIAAYGKDKTMPGGGYVFSFNQEHNKYVYQRESISLASEKKKTQYLD
ncbi:MAG: hypothetical protein FWH53_00165 [Leptospirales bacterium]|nr:hypothetical protein [Leptospirales bacterium]